MCICVCIYIYMHIHIIYIYSQSGVDGTWKLQKKNTKLGMWRCLRISYSIYFRMIMYVSNDLLGYHWDTSKKNRDNDGDSIGDFMGCIIICSWQISWGRDTVTPSKYDWYILIWIQCAVWKVIFLHLDILDTAPFWVQPHVKIYGV